MANRWTPHELECLVELEARAADSPPETQSTASTTAATGTAACPSRSVALWDNFETCAQSVVSLYRQQTWQAFQHAAEQCTLLYKDSVDNYNNGVEHGQMIGRQRLLKELLGFVKCSSVRSKPYIRREDLLTFLAARPRTYQRSGTQPDAVSANAQVRGTTTTAAAESNSESGDLSAMHLFHEALARTSGGNNSPVRGSPSRRMGSGELNTFLAAELRRNRKRRRQSAASVSMSLSTEHNPIQSQMDTSSPNALFKRARYSHPAMDPLGH